MDTTHNTDSIIGIIEEKVEIELSHEEKLLIEQVMRDLMSDVFASGNNEDVETV